MTKRQKAAAAAKELDRLYPAPRIPLDSRGTFTFLVAVVLSAQCTDKRVNEVTPKLFRLADTPQKMAKLDEEKIREIIRPCGLSQSKAKNIKSLSRDIVEKFGGEVPRTFEELESLAGVGHKTASVIMQQAFGVPAFPVDTHIHRLAKRWGLSSGKSVEQTEKDLKKLYPPEDWGKLHLQFIYYGREHCRAHTCKTPETLCGICRMTRNA
ncbi:MAG: endonuclease III [Verrucomicrobia bacterium]|nr:MAG: endonuclease III [Verrucomicrobiota bacterium]